MNGTLLDISRKIKPQRAAALLAVGRVARSLGVPCFVVGAAARDSILEDGYDIRTIRATMDVDIAVGVSSWDEYAKLTDALLTDEHFVRTSIEHRFELRLPGRMLVDILPFGAVENVSRNIHWPHEDRDMNMAGFSEASRMTIDVRISSEPPALVKMVSLAGLAMLKIVSWNEAPLARDRDARDFRLLMYKYLETQSIDAVFEAHSDITSVGDYDLISARLLGRDMAVVAGVSLRPAIHDILVRECDPDGRVRFIQQMQSAGADREAAIPRDLSMLSAVLQGVADPGMAARTGGSA
jgi:predicted nucleotidyltransferase